jgi:beta-lactamase regulating signal transducer with metallopeptidase domain
MIAAWMIYVTVITVLAGIVAFAAEWGLRAIRLPARFAWLGAIALVWLFAIIAAVSHPASPVASVAVASQRIAPAATNGLSTSASTPVSQSNHTLFIEPNSTLAKLDVPLMTLWAVASILCILAIFASAIRLRIARRNWREEAVDSVPVYVSHDVGPAVSGIIGYSIVVPRWIFDLPSEHRRFIITHEREHVRAADPALLFIGALAIVAMPWNAAVWYVVRRLQMATEIDCDQRVLELIPEPAAYAHLLLDVGERAINSPIPIAALTERPSLLQRRIEKMTAQQPRSPWSKSALAATVAGVVFFVACQTPRPYSTSSPSERIPQLASELSALMRNDSAMESLSPEQRIKIRNQLNSAVAESRGNFAPSGAALYSLVKLYYPEIIATRPAAGTLVAFVFDEQDSLIRRTTVAGVGSGWNATQKTGELFPELKGRPVRAAGISRIPPSKDQAGGNGPIIIVYESFRDPNSVYSMKHRNRLLH